MFTTQDLIKRLKPIIGNKSDPIWNAYLASDPQERRLTHQSLEQLHTQLIDNYQNEKIILSPPSNFYQLHGDYPIGTIIYADKSLYPFSLQETELTQHIGVFGRTGSGKTYFVKNLLLTHIKLNRPVIIFDWKGTYTDLPNLIPYGPGSNTHPFYFNPLDLSCIDPEFHTTYLRQIVELLIQTYLENLQLLTTQGVETLLLKSIETLKTQQIPLTIQNLYHWINKYEGRLREMDWKVSATNILYKITKSPLGKVMTNKTVNLNWLCQKQILFELNNIGNAQDKTFFIKTLLLRLYYHFKNNGVTDRLQLLIVIEEAHNILLKKNSESILELMLRQIREFGVGFCIVDQHPSLISLPALGTYTTVAFNLNLKQDREAMASALNLEQTEYLGKLPSRFAIVKIQDRYLQPFLIKTFTVKNHIEIDSKKCFELYCKIRLGTPLKQPNSFQGKNETPPTQITQIQPFRTQANNKTSNNPNALKLHPVSLKMLTDKRVFRAFRIIKQNTQKPVTWEELFLSHIYATPLLPTVQRYTNLGLNKYQGHKFRKSLALNNLITLQTITTKKGSFKLMVPTKIGFDFLKKRGFKAGNSHKHGGIEHRYWIKRLQLQFEKLGYSVTQEYVIQGNSAVDLLVSKGKTKISVEIETGKNSTQQIQSNIQKCLSHFNGVVSFILDSHKSKRVSAHSNRAIIVTSDIECVQAVNELMGDAKLKK